MESYSDSDDDGIEIGRHGDGSEAAADIFSYFFWRNFMVKQVALVELGTWVLMFLIMVLHYVFVGHKNCTIEMLTLVRVHRFCSNMAHFKDMDTHISDPF